MGTNINSINISYNVSFKNIYSVLPGLVYDNNNWTGDFYIRDSITGKPISAPARVITLEEQANALKAEYEAKVKAIDEAIQIAKNNNDDEYVSELQQERQNILDEYAKKLEELTNA